MLTYHESVWAVKRWDWFNGGRTVEPLSFCQFWRTVLVWATLKWLFSPLPMIHRAAAGVPLPRAPLLKPLGYPFVLLAKGFWFVLRLVCLLLWRSFLLVAKPVGGRALAGAVAVGKPVTAWGTRHETGLNRSLKGLAIVFYGGLVILWLVIFLLASWFWTLVALGVITVGGFAAFGFLKSGALGLLWQAGVATHHGVCPPVEILREGRAETP